MRRVSFLLLQNGPTKAKNAASMAGNTVVNLDTTKELSLEAYVALNRLLQAFIDHVSVFHTASFSKSYTESSYCTVPYLLVKQFETCEACLNENPYSTQSQTGMLHLHAQ